MKIATRMLKKKSKLYLAFVTLGNSIGETVASASRRTPRATYALAVRTQTGKKKSNRRLYVTFKTKSENATLLLRAALLTTRENLAIAAHRSRRSCRCCREKVQRWKLDQKTNFHSPGGGFVVNLIGFAGHSESDIQSPPSQV
jgi:hypothetical protein